MSNAVMGTKRLSEIRNGAGIPFLTPEVSPGTHCPMRLASVIAQDIKGLSSLLVGMPECATYSRMFNPKPEGEDGEMHWLYVLDSREVVFGCRDGVMEAIEKMQQLGAKAILVTGTCVPDLIGEDFRGLVEELQPKLRIKIAHNMLGQFKNISYPSGSWKTMKCMAQLMEKTTVGTNIVNVLGRSPSEEHTPMPTLLPFLEKKGFDLRYLAPGSTLEEFQAAPEAKLNLVLSPYTYPLALEMQEKFETPFITLHDCYSVEDINKAYDQVCKQLGITAEDAFAQEREIALALEQEVKECCEGMHFALALRVDLPLPLTRYLISTFNMNPTLLHLEEYYPEDKAHSQQIKELGVNPLVCRIVDENNALAVMKQYNHDICFGYLPNVDTQRYWVENMLDFYGQVGYTRTQALLSRVLSVVSKKEGV